MSRIGTLREELGSAMLRGFIKELDDRARLIPDVGGNACLIQGLELSVDETYFHCPRAFRFADVTLPAGPAHPARGAWTCTAVRSSSALRLRSGSARPRTAR